MAELEELRKKLDEIDDQIAGLFESRMRVCGQVGEYKIHSGRKVFDDRGRRRSSQTWRRR